MLAVEVCCETPERLWVAKACPSWISKAGVHHSRVGVSFNRDGTVVRVCFIAWRRGELIGARYITAKQLRQQERIYVDPRLQNAKLDTAASSPNN
jgi:hypothetical protein